MKRPSVTWRFRRSTTNKKLKVYKLINLSNNPIKETWMLVARVKTIPSSIRLIDSIYNKVPMTLKKLAEVNVKYIFVL